MKPCPPLATPVAGAEEGHGGGGRYGLETAVHVLQHKLHHGGIDVADLGMGPGAGGGMRGQGGGNEGLEGW